MTGECGAGLGHCHLFSATLRPACKEGSCMDPTCSPHFSYSPRPQIAYRDDPVIDRRTFLAVTGAVLLAAPLVAEAQQAGKVWRVGLLVPAVGPWRGRPYQGFEEALRELGYIEGRNLTFEYPRTGDDL